MTLLALIGCGWGSGLDALSSGEPTDGQVRPLIVAIHGYGGRPEELLKLVRDCGLDAWVVAPRGPELHPGGHGFSWYPPTFADHGVDRSAAGVRAAADGLADLIRSERARHPVSRVVVTGFSQGGVLSFALATLHPDLVDAAIPISGGLPADLVPKDPPPPHAPPIRALHGDHDEILALRDTRERVNQLRARGWDVDLEEFPGVGHQISLEMDQALCRDLQAAVSPAGPGSPPPAPAAPPATDSPGTIGSTPTR